MWVVVIFVLSVMCVVGECVFVSIVHPVAILSAVFCVICSLLMVLSDVTIWWKRTKLWVLLWLCMVRRSFPFVFPVLLM